MADIHQSLVNPTIKFSEVAPSGFIKSEFFSLGEIVKEEEGQIINIHTSGVSFGLPTSALDLIKDLPLNKHPFGYIEVSGYDVNGNKKDYAIKVDDESKNRLAWNLYTALGVVHGQPFIRTNADEWRHWFEMKKIEPEVLKTLPVGTKIIVQYTEDRGFLGLASHHDIVTTGEVELQRFDPESQRVTFKNKKGKILEVSPINIYDPS